MSATATPPAPDDAAEAAVRRRVQLNFSRNGDAKPYLKSGWSLPEGQHTWSIGPESTLVVPSPGFRNRATLSVTGWPHLQPGWLTRQRILITVNGAELGRLVMLRRSTLTGIIPRQALLGQDTLTITLRHPDAASPTDFPSPTEQFDTRILGVAYHRLTIEEMDDDLAKLSARIRKTIKTPVPERRLVAAPVIPASAARTEAAGFLKHFQSLGDDCEFGIVQRHTGIEPLGLFRFCKVAIEHIIGGFQAGFAGMAEDENFQIVEYTHAPGHDYMGRERKYGMLYHTHRLPGQIDPDLLKTQEMARLRFMARKIMEDAALPDQIFVVKRKQRLLVEEVARLVLALRDCGPSQLVWVCEAYDDIPPGTAERVTDRLIVAYVDRIDVAPLREVSLESWIAACRAAWVVYQEK